ALAAVLAPAPPAGAGTVVFKIATLSPEGAPWMVHMREGAAEIARRTSGRVAFKFYPGGVMGNDQSVLRKIRVGQLGGGAVTGGSLSSVFPDVAVYGIPFLFDSLDEVDYVRRRMDPGILEGLEQRGFVSFGLAEGGFVYLMSAAPIRAVADLRRRKVWVPSGDVVSTTVFKALGVTPIPLPLADVLTGLETGLVDTVATSPIGAIALQWHTRIRYLTDIPLSYVYGLLVVDRRLFSRLSPADQAVVREVMSRVFRELDRQNRDENRKALEALRRQGITFVEAPPEEVAELKRIAAGAVDDLAGKGVYRPATLAALRTHLAEYRRRAAAARGGP
ncbi:C4-dicarboxylate ABC transporter, partial [Dissulfurirhabdus thermomarina]